MTSWLFPLCILFLPLGYGILSLYAARAFFSRNTPASDTTPPVTILKPIKGADSETYENFASFCRQDYPSFQLVFAAAATDDPAVSLVRRLSAEFPLLSIDLSIDPTVHGANGKVSNLINALPHCLHDLILVSDSDVRVDQDYIRRIVPFFTDPTTGLVTSLYRRSGCGDLVGQLEALTLSVEMMPNVLVACWLEGLSFALGASMAVRREALLSIGGFAALVDYLADDYHLGNKIKSKGWTISLSPHFVSIVQGQEDFRSFIMRQLRWGRTMRVSRPWGYLGSGMIQPVICILFALIMTGFSPAGLILVAVVYAFRLMLLMGTSCRCFGCEHRMITLLPLPLRDVLASLVWLLSLMGNRVEWGREIYRVRSDGTLVSCNNEYSG